MCVKINKKVGKSVDLPTFFLVIWDEMVYDDKKLTVEVLLWQKQYRIF